MDIDSIVSILDASFLYFLVELDCQSFELAKEKGCHFCGAKLHSAKRTRKLRLPDRVEMKEEFQTFFSLCCSGEGCRKRNNPQSVRFAGRSPNLMLLVIFAGFLKKGTSERKLSFLSKNLGVTERTLTRWKKFWQRVYNQSKFWRNLRIIWALGKDGLSLLFHMLLPCACGEVA